MNKTKRKIFEASMKLFAEKGYDATSVEEITATVGVAKGTLYYHFSSKEEIFNFLIDEGVKLLLNNIELKIKKLDNSVDKLRAVIILQIRVLKKYENLIKIFLSQIWGDEPRNVRCKKTIIKYISEIEKIVKEGQEKGEIKNGDSTIIASDIFSVTCSSMIVKLMKQEELDVKTMSKEFDKILSGFENKK